MNETRPTLNITLVLRVVIACGFLTSLGIGLVSFTLPLVSLDAKVSGAWLGSGFAGFFLARLLVGPLGGLWADRTSPRKPLLFATALAAIIPIIYLVYPSVSALYVIQFILGVSSGLIRPVGLAILGGNADTDHLSKWFSAQVLAFNAALFAGPLLGGLLYLDRSMEFVLQGLSICMIAAFCLVYIGLPAGILSKRAGEQRKEPSTDGRKRFYVLLIAIFGRTFGIGLTIAFYPILLSLKLGLSGLMVGALFSLAGLATCLGLLFLPVIKRYIKGDLVLIGMMASAIAVMAAGVSFEVWHFVIAGIVLGMGSALSIPETMTAASTSMRNQGAVFGSTHVATGLGFVLGPLAGGMFIQLTGNIGHAFVLAGLIGWACLLPWCICCRSKRSLVPHGLVVGLFLLIFMAAGAVSHLSHGEPEQDSLFHYTDVAMGTVVNLTLVADSQKAADDGARKALAFMRTVQRDLDYRDSQGSVARINQAAGSRFVKPTDRAYALIKRAVDFSRLTDGVFDPTIGALTTSPLYYVLDETIAQSKKSLVNYRLVSFETKDKRVLLDKQGMALDLGGIAKGAIIDATVKLLRKLHIRAGIVEAGGDFYCFGERDWTVGIRHPRDKSVYGTVTVREKGVCGSGDYQQFVKYEEEGETNLRHHIINPSDMGAADISAGVTVIAESAELADGMATTLFIMGPNKGRAFVGDRYPAVAAMWFTPDLRVITTDSFPK